MTFRVYLRWPNQRVSDKTVTESREVADMAYAALLKRAELVGKPVAAAFSENGQQLAYHRFDVAESAGPSSERPASGNR